VKKQLPCEPSQARPFLSQLEDEIFLFCEEEEDGGWDALTAKFGAPEDAAINFLLELEPAALWKYQRQKMRLMVAVVCVTAILVLAMRFHTYVKQQSFMDGYWKEYITEMGEMPMETVPPIEKVKF